MSRKIAAVPILIISTLLVVAGVIGVWIFPARGASKGRSFINSFDGESGVYSKATYNSLNELLLAGNPAVSSDFLKKLTFNAKDGTYTDTSPTSDMTAVELARGLTETEGPFTYRRAIAVSGSVAGDEVNYLLPVTLTTVELGKPYAYVRSDGSDIRFTAADGLTVIPYWIETWDNRADSKIRVEVPFIPSEGTTIYLYYGNASVKKGAGEIPLNSEIPPTPPLQKKGTDTFFAPEAGTPRAIEFVSANLVYKFPKRQPITITGSSAGALTHYAVEVTVTHNPDMQPDFDDIRFVDVNFPYRKAVIISGSSITQTDYQVRVDVVYETGMNFDFSGIRFTDSEGGKLLDYYRESYTTYTSAVFYVRVPSIPPKGTTIYLYYGNASAVSASNAEDTFLFYDDFEDGVLDRNKWFAGTEGEGGSYVEADGFLQLAASDVLSGSAWARTVSPIFTNGFVIEYRRYDTEEHYNNISFGYGTLSGRDEPEDWWHTILKEGYWCLIRDNNDWQYGREDGAGREKVLQDLINGPDAGQWIEHRISYDSRGSWRWSADTGMGYVLQGRGQRNILYLKNEKDILISRGAYSGGNFGGRSKIDWFRVRKYADPEPTAVVGATEGAMGGLPLPYRRESYSPSDTATFRIEMASIPDGNNPYPGNETTVYIYYGNSAAPKKGTDTFFDSSGYRQEKKKVSVPFFGEEEDDATYAPSGIYVSGSIANSEIRQGTLTYNKYEPVNTTLTMDVLDASDDSLLAADVASGTDLGAIVPPDTAIKLRANLITTDNMATPQLSGWAITYYDRYYSSGAFTYATTAPWTVYRITPDWTVADLPPSTSLSVDISADGGDSWKIGAVSENEYSAPSDFSAGNRIVWRMNLSSFTGYDDQTPKLSSFTLNYSGGDVSVDAPPLSGEVWYAGETKKISWTSSGIDAVKIDYTPDGFTYKLIIDSVDSSSGYGSYSWVVPNDPSAAVKIRVSDAVDSLIHAFSNEFQLHSRLTLVEPNGGETYSAGDVLPVSWMSSGTLQEVKLEYSVDGGVNYDHIITTSIPHQGKEFTLGTDAYAYRVPITIINRAGTALKSGHSVSFTFDDQSLVSAGKSLASGDDLRVGYSNGTGYVELDRTVEGVGTAFSTVTFRTRADIAAGNSSLDYYLYYGNSAVGVSPADGKKVYIEDDLDAVALWHMDEGSGNTVSDQTDNNNTGTRFNFTNGWIEGKFKKALNFDGSDDYVGVNDEGGLNFGRGSFSITVWVKLRSLQDGVFVSKRETSGYSLMLSIGEALFYIEDVSGNWAELATAILPGAWHHLAGVRDTDAGEIRLYLDGKMVGRARDTTGNLDSAHALEMGGITTQEDYWLDGAIDEVAIFDSILTSAQISNIYSNYLEKKRVTEVNPRSGVVVRKYIDPEPAIVLGAEQGNLGFYNWKIPDAVFDGEAGSYRRVRLRVSDAATPALSLFDESDGDFTIVK